MSAVGVKAVVGAVNDVMRGRRRSGLLLPSSEKLVTFAQRSQEYFAA